MAWRSTRQWSEFSSVTRGSTHTASSSDVRETCTACICPAHEHQMSRWSLRCIDERRSDNVGLVTHPSLAAPTARLREEFSGVFSPETARCR